MLRFSDARNFGRTLTALCLIAGPILLLISQIVTPDVSDSNELKELANVAAHDHAFRIGNFGFLVASIVLLGASVGLIRLFRGPRGVTLGQLAGGLLVLGSATTMMFYTFGVFEHEMVWGRSGDTAQMARLLSRVNDSNALIPLFVLFTVGVVLGSLLLAVAVYRTRIVPVWTAGLLVAAGIASFFVTSKALQIVAFALYTVALGMLGRKVLSMSDEEWGRAGWADPA